jgi:hypothetical protein
METCALKSPLKTLFISVAVVPKLLSFSTISDELAAHSITSSTHPIADIAARRSDACMNQPTPAADRMKLDS